MLCGKGKLNVQFPITAVFTTSVSTLSWFSAVFSLRRAVVYQSQMDTFAGRVWARTEVAATAVRARDL